MSTRLNPDVYLDTKQLLGNLLAHLNQDERVSFLTPAGEGATAMQRARMMLSRVRKKMEAKGMNRQHFRMLQEIYPYTENGVRYDCVLVYRKKDAHHRIMEKIEEMAGL
jgi:hypothetical protein